MKEAILKCLKETDGYVSGQRLCEMCGVSRTAIWKVMSQLREEGYEIDAVKNRGYRLTSAPDRITPEEIYSHLKTKWACRPTVYYEETDSTNDRIRKLYTEGYGHGTLAVTELQNAGKGRRGRVWQSPKGTNIAHSLLLIPEIHPMNASMLTLVAGLAVCQVLSREVPDARIKWPNDVVIGGKKVCGILTEMSCEMDYINYVVLGIGLNVNTETFPEEIEAVATSLYLATGKKYSRSELIANIWEAFESVYETFIRTEDMPGLMDAYNKLLVSKDRQVMIEERGTRSTGIAEGIDREGCLIVRMEDGSKRHIMSGEVSVRGVLGYV